MKIPNIKSLKDADRFCKKQLRDMKVFATNKGEKYIEKNAKNDIIILKKIFEDLKTDYNIFLSDKNEENFNKISETLITQIDKMNGVSIGIFKKYINFIKDNGYMIPLAKVTQMTDIYKKANRNREKCMLIKNITEVQNTIKDFFIENYQICIESDFEKNIEYIFYIMENLNEFEKQLEEQQNEQAIEKVIEGIVKNEKKKIFDYKQMNELMVQNGFEPVRQKGSHRVFSNDTHSIVVPQHQLGKGLSFEIQSQIQRCI